MNNGIGYRAIDSKLHEVTQNFAQLVNDAPPELRARQFVRRETKDGYLFVEIRSTFKIAQEALKP